MVNVSAQVHLVIQINNSNINWLRIVLWHLSLDDNKRKHVTAVCRQTCLNMVNELECLSNLFQVTSTGGYTSKFGVTLNLVDFMIENSAQRLQIKEPR